VPSMKKPPGQLATPLLVPANRSALAITLEPADPGDCDAHHEIVRWVTNCAAQPPEIVQIVRGCVASATSASAVEGAPCITSKASCAVGAPAQVEVIAAHDGTVGPGGLGDGEGVGDGLGVRGVVGDDEDDAKGVVLTFTPGVIPQADKVTTVIRPNSPTFRPTGLGNAT